MCIPSTEGDLSALVLSHHRCDMAERCPALLHPLLSLLEVESGQVVTAVPKNELEDLMPMFGKGNMPQQIQNPSVFRVPPLSPRCSLAKNRDYL